MSKLIVKDVEGNIRLKRDINPTETIQDVKNDVFAFLKLEGVSDLENMVCRSHKIFEDDQPKDPRSMLDSYARNADYLFTNEEMGVFCNSLFDETLTGRENLSTVELHTLQTKSSDMYMGCDAGPRVLKPVKGINFKHIADDSKNTKRSMFLQSKAAYFQKGPKRAVNSLNKERDYHGEKNSNHASASSKIFPRSSAIYLEDVSGSNIREYKVIRLSEYSQDTDFHRYKHQSVGNSSREIHVHSKSFDINTDLLMENTSLSNRLKTNFQDPSLDFDALRPSQSCLMESVHQYLEVQGKAVNQEFDSGANIGSVFDDIYGSVIEKSGEGTRDSNVATTCKGGNRVNVNENASPGMPSYSNSVYIPCNRHSPSKSFEKVIEQWKSGRFSIEGTTNDARISLETNSNFLLSRNSVVGKCESDGHTDKNHNIGLSSLEDHKSSQTATHIHGRAVPQDSAFRPNSEPLKKQMELKIVYNGKVIHDKTRICSLDCGEDIVLVYYQKLCTPLNTTSRALSLNIQKPADKRAPLTTENFFDETKSALKNIRLIGQLDENALHDRALKDQTPGPVQSSKTFLENVTPFGSSKCIPSAIKKEKFDDKLTPMRHITKPMVENNLNNLPTDSPGRVMEAETIYSKSSSTIPGKQLCIDDQICTNSIEDTMKVGILMNGRKLSVDPSKIISHNNKVYLVTKRQKKRDLSMVIRQSISTIKMGLIVKVSAIIALFMTGNQSFAFMLLAIMLLKFLSKYNFKINMASMSTSEAVWKTTLAFFITMFCINSDNILVMPRKINPKKPI